MGIYGKYAKRLIESKVKDAYEEEKENEMNPITGLDPLRDEQGRVKNQKDKKSIVKENSSQELDRDLLRDHEADARAAWSNLLYYLNKSNIDPNKYSVNRINNEIEGHHKIIFATYRLYGDNIIKIKQELNDVCKDASKDYSCHVKIDASNGEFSFRV